MAVAEKTGTTAPETTETNGEVALIAPPRLPYHPALSERFGVDRASWRALIDAVFPSAKTTDAVVLALSYCKARKLDPFKRVVHIVPVWDNEKRGYVETVWPGIAEHRTTAFRTKQYAGAEAAQFGPTVEKNFKGMMKGDRPVEATVKFPEWAQLTVFRMIDGQRVPMPGPRVYWLETYSRMGRTEVPNDRWQRAPFQMIEKCAEAAALRRAFPEELGDEQTVEEAGALYRGAAEGDDAKDVTPARPTRAEFTEPVEEPWEFTDALGEVTSIVGAAAWVATFARALGDEKAPADMLDGLWETNSPLLARLRATGPEGERAAQALHDENDRRLAARNKARRAAAEQQSAAEAPAQAGEVEKAPSGEKKAPAVDLATILPYAEKIARNSGSEVLESWHEKQSAAVKKALAAHWPELIKLARSTDAHAAKREGGQ